MKRPHRRAHLLIWMILAPAALGLAGWRLMTPPADPFTDLPNAIATEAP